MKVSVSILILAMSFTLLMFFSISPVLAEISKSFPEASISEIQIIFTLVSLVCIIGMLAAGKLTNSLSKRNIIIAGLVILTTGGLMPLLLHNNIWMLYLSSILLGFGIGLVNVISSAIISDHYTGMDKVRMMGYQCTAVSIGGTLVPVLSGYIAVNGWVYSYLTYLICIPILVIVIFCLPKDKVVPQTEKYRPVIHRRLIYFGILGLFMAIFMNAFNTNIAMFLKDAQLGDASIAGFVNSMFTLMGIPAGLITGSFIKIFGKKLPGIAALIAASGFLLIFFANNMVLVFIGSILIGLGFSIRTPVSITFSANMVPRENAALGIIVCNSFYSLGNFLSPLIVNFMALKLGDSISIKFILSCAFLVGIGILLIATNPVSDREVIENQT